MSALGLAVGAIPGPVRHCKSDDAVVEIPVAVEVQLKGSHGYEIQEHSFCCGDMAGELLTIVSPESSDCI
jgi:hypothetical protein